RIAPRLCSARARGRGALSYAVQPANRHARPGVAEGLEFVVPSLPEGKVKVAAQPQRIPGMGHRRADPILGYHDVAVHVGLSVEDPEIGGVAPPAPVATAARLFGVVIAEVDPAAQGGGDPSAGTHRPDPGHFGSIERGCGDRKSTRLNSSHD